jgi:hypothetical protein
VSIAIDKDPSILQLLEQLDLPRNGWAIVDHWEADLCAIGLARPSAPRRLVYVSTYGKTEGEYDYQCEEALGSEPDDYVTTDARQGVDLPTLVAVLRRHLDRA